MNNSNRQHFPTHENPEYHSQKHYQHNCDRPSESQKRNSADEIIDAYNSKYFKYEFINNNPDTSPFMHHKQYLTETQIETEYTSNQNLKTLTSIEQKTPRPNNNKKTQQRNLSKDKQIQSQDTSKNIESLKTERNLQKKNANSKTISLNSVDRKTNLNSQRGVNQKPLKNNVSTTPTNQSKVNAVKPDIEKIAANHCKKFEEQLSPLNARKKSERSKKQMLEGTGKQLVPLVNEDGQGHDNYSSRRSDNGKDQGFSIDFSKQYKNKLISSYLSPKSNILDCNVGLEKIGDEDFGGCSEKLYVSIVSQKSETNPNQKLGINGQMGLIQQSKDNNDNCIREEDLETDKTCTFTGYSPNTAINHKSSAYEDYKNLTYCISGDGGDTLGHIILENDSDKIDAEINRIQEEESKFLVNVNSFDKQLNKDMTFAIREQNFEETKSMEIVENLDTNGRILPKKDLESPLRKLKKPWPIEVKQTKDYFNKKLTKKITPTKSCKAYLPCSLQVPSIFV